MLDCRDRAPLGDISSDIDRLYGDDALQGSAASGDRMLLPLQGEKGPGERRPKPADVLLLLPPPKLKAETYESLRPTIDEDEIDENEPW